MFSERIPAETVKKFQEGLRQLGELLRDEGEYELATILHEHWWKMDNTKDDAFQKAKDGMREHLHRIFREAPKSIQEWMRTSPFRNLV